jgi:hypothetical protein
MPIVSHSKSHDVFSTIQYIMEKPGAQNLGGSMLGETALELSQQIMLAAPLNRKVKRHLYVASVSMPLGHRLSDEVWQMVGFEFRELMGFQGHPYGLVRHTDRPHDHVHIFIGRIGMDGKCIKDGWDYYKAQSAMRILEKRYDLPQLQSSWETIEKAPNLSQIRHSKQQESDYAQGLRDRPSDLTIRNQLVATLKANVADQPRLPELIERLQDQGIEVRVDLTRPGISFQVQGIKCRGSSLGRGFSFNGLQKHFQVKYDSQEDDAKIKELMERPVNIIESNPEATLLTEPTEDQIDSNLLNEVTETDLELNLLGGAAEVDVEPLSDEPSFARDPNSTWEQVQAQIEPYQFNIELIHWLYEAELLAIDKKKRLVFGTLTLDGEEPSSLALNEDGTFESMPPQSPTSSFWLARNASVDRIIIVSDPLEAIATYSIEEGNIEAEKTLYLAASHPEQIPTDLLEHTEQVYLSTSCNETIAAIVNGSAPHHELIIPDHEDGWLGQWQRLQRELNEEITQPEIQRDREAQLEL